MEVITRLHTALVPRKKTVVALGTFDGVHKGHQKIIKAVVGKAKKLRTRSLVMSFHPHPLNVVAPLKAPMLLTTTAKKISIIESLGVDICFLVLFNKSFAAMTPQEFIREVLVKILNVREVVVGENYRFGVKKIGDVALLKRMGELYGFKVTALKQVKVDGEVVSSTRIRKAVKDGDLKLAKRCLGRYYSIIGKVVSGARRGREIGFPTANIRAYHEVIPEKGVYIGFLRNRNKIYRAVLNIGTRPTFDEKDVIMESHILDFKGDIYNQQVEFVPIIKIREEKAFKERDELIVQIKSDERLTRSLLKKPLTKGVYF